MLICIFDLILSVVGISKSCVYAYLNLINNSNTIWPSSVHVGGIYTIYFKQISLHLYVYYHPVGARTGI